MVLKSRHIHALISCLLAVMISSVLGITLTMTTPVSGIITNSSDISTFLNALPNESNRTESAVQEVNQSITNIPLISEENGSGFTSFEDDDIGFKLQYPSDWKTDTSNTEHATVATFKSPNDEVSVDVRIFPKGDYKSIKDFGDKTFKQSKDSTLLQYYRNSTTLLSGKPAIKAVYLTSYNPSVFENALGYSSSTSKAMMVATVVPEKKSIFGIAYFATSENFNEFLPAVDHIIRSFEIDTKGPIIQEEN